MFINKISICCALCWDPIQMSEISKPCKVEYEDELKRINFLTYGRLHIFAIKDNILKT